LKPLTSQELKTYWESLSSSLEAQLRTDPEGLGIVCDPGEPLWLNRFYAQFQKVAYEELFAMIPESKATKRALNLGCGTRRWANFLHDHGYSVVGIDIQPRLIETNRVRFPEIEFRYASIQEFQDPRPYDLASSVTVLQHLPFDEQDQAIQHIGRFVAYGGCSRT